jgi:Diacylglycerol kinase catalytic domain
LIMSNRHSASTALRCIVAVVVLLLVDVLFLPVSCWYFTSPIDVVVVVAVPVVEGFPVPGVVMTTMPIRTRLQPFRRPPENVHTRAIIRTARRSHCHYDASRSFIRFHGHYRIPSSRSYKMPMGSDPNHEATTTTTRTSSLLRVNGDHNSRCLTDDENNVRSATVATTTTTGRLMHPPKTQRTTTTNIRVILNANARGVTPNTIQTTRDVFSRDDDQTVHVTHTISDLYTALESILLLLQHPSTQQQQLEQTILVIMGGDGTLSTTIQTMCQILFRHRSTKTNPRQACNDTTTNEEYNNNNNNLHHEDDTDRRTSTVSQQEQQQDSQSYTSMISQLPIIAYVPLGTGNAVGSVVGCTYSTQPEIGTVVVVPPKQQQPPPQRVHKVIARTVQRIRNQLLYMLPFGRRLPRPAVVSSSSSSEPEQNIASKSYKQQSNTLRSILQQIQHTIQTHSTTTLPITVLPMMEITSTKTAAATATPTTSSLTNSTTDLCFFAGGNVFLFYWCWYFGVAAIHQ